MFKSQYNLIFGIVQVEKYNQILQNNPFKYLLSGEFVHVCVKMCVHEYVCLHMCACMHMCVCLQVHMCMLV